MGYRGRVTGAVCLSMALLFAAPAAGNAAPGVHRGAVPSARGAELDPTLIYDFPTAPLHVEPGRTWTLPVRVNQDVGGRPAYLQRQVGGRWVTVDRTRAQRYRLRFAVKESRQGSFRYRVVVPAHGGFEARTSKVQTVLVAPVSPQTQQFFVPDTISGTLSGHDMAFGATTMSWSGRVTFTRVPYESSGVSPAVSYRPTALSVDWSVDYADWRGCRFAGGGTIGLSAVAFPRLGGVPEEFVAPMGRPNEYDFDLGYESRTPQLVGTVTCPGEQPQPKEFASSMGYLLRTDRQSYGFSPDLRLQYVDGLPESGWVRMVGATDPADPSAGSVVNAWDLIGSGRTPFVRPAP